MVLYLIGLGLGSPDDITVRGLNVIQQSHSVYLEQYTSVLPFSITELEAVYKCRLIAADRQTIESRNEQLLADAFDKTVSVLVVGDPLGATTHTDLIRRARKRGITVRLVHNASIMNAVASCGLSLYNFGQAVSVPFAPALPLSAYDKIAVNATNGFHTLVLLDIRVKEQTNENIAKGSSEYEPPRFMTVNQCIEILLRMEKEQQKQICLSSTKAFALCRLGQPNERIVSGTLSELASIDHGSPLHSLVLVGRTHEIENEMYWDAYWDANAGTIRREAEHRDEEAAAAAKLAEQQAERSAAYQRRIEFEAKRKNQQANASAPKHKSATVSITDAQESENANGAEANGNDDDDEEYLIEPF